MKRLFWLVLPVAMMLTGCTKNKVENITPEYDRSDFVEVTEVIPDVILEIRYYST